MREKYDVIIIGAGPAGLSCAIELQKSGKSVLLIEKNKEIGHKVCAGGLTTKIESLNISLNVCDVLFSSVKINFAGKEKTVSGDKPFVGTIDRIKFGRMLLNKLSKKVEIKTGETVARIDSKFVEVGSQKIKYEYLVGADGSSSTVRKFLGLSNDKFVLALQYILPREFKNLELFFDAYLFGLGYAWVFPHKGYTSIGCGQDEKFIKKSELLNNFKKWLKKKKIEIKDAELQGGIINFDYQGFEFGNKFLIGDAAGFVSKATGEGIYFAMVSGIEVAKKIVDKNYRYGEILKILEIKNKHEKILKFLESLMLSNKFLLNSWFKSAALLLNSKKFAQKALKLFS